ncbi:DUF3010 family protein [Aquimarina litoralis]|uniref:DUF3010 family protein n=1 Tax=Aquimarina litoralis TaxID=584605 RepID=UPI001C567B87|nr:DUF3010 family protein [Aquimarina litoralis]MBW1296738.1 DUF3010 family protein [Aquimarina litoralis]
MKTIGIEIDKKRAICVIVSKDANGVYQNVTGKTKYIEIKDDHNNYEIQDFLKKIEAFFDEVAPLQIGIISRQTKGKFAAAAVSFKLEALIQCYTKAEITFVSKQTLTAFYKKNELPVSYDNAYQENATKLAAYLSMK